MIHGGVSMTWKINIQEEVPPTPEEEKALPSWVYAVPIIGVLLLALKRRRR